VTTMTASTDEKDKNNDDNANSEDEDEDYNPEHDKDADADEDDAGNGAEAMDDAVMEEMESVLAPSQKKAVDEAFQDLFGYSWGTTFQLPRRQRRQQHASRKKSPTVIDDSEEEKKTNLLVRMLGPDRAARILQMGASMQRRVPLAKRHAAHLKSIGSTELIGGGNNIIATTNTAYSSQQPHYETKLFAGKKIQVAVQPGGATSFAAAAASKKKPSAGGGIDSVLQQIAGPAKISTVAKTSADWDSFKTETGLEAELEKKAQGKDAFLIKQDFLSRVDNRTFELEKGERDRERAKRGT
jgi:Bucentaur or craniofacial development